MLIDTIWPSLKVMSIGSMDKSTAVVLLPLSISGLIVVSPLNDVSHSVIMHILSLLSFEHISNLYKDVKWADEAQALQIEELKRENANFINTPALLQQQIERPVG